MNLTNKGFTLIELLVVVLIIAILAAVALPQYQRVVIKSRFMSILPILTAIKQAEEIHYLDKGNYIGTVNNLNINIRCTFTTDQSFFTCDPYFAIDTLEGTNYYVRAYYCPHSPKTYPTCHNEADFYYTLWFAHSERPNQTICTGITDFGKDFCKRI